MAASSSRGGIRSEEPAQTAPKERAEAMASLSFGPGEGVEAAALKADDLREDMRCGAESVQADVLRFGAHAERPESDQSTAEQRRQAGRRRGLVDGEAVAGVRSQVFGVSARPGIPREARPIAEVLEPAAAIPAALARVPQPGHADALPRRKRIGRRSDHRAHDLVSGDDGIGNIGKLAVQQVQVRAAHRAGLYPDEHLSLPYTGLGQISQRQCLTRTLKYHGAPCFRSRCSVALLQSCAESLLAGRS